MRRELTPHTSSSVLMLPVSSSSRISKSVTVQISLGRGLTLAVEQLKSRRLPDEKKFWGLDENLLQWLYKKFSTFIMSIDVDIS